MIEITTQCARTKVSINGTDIGNHITEMNLHWKPDELPTIELFVVDTECVKAVIDQADITVRKV